MAKKTHWFRKIVIITGFIFFIIIISALTILGTTVGVSLALVGEYADDWNQADLNTDINTTIYDAQGQVLTVLHAEKNREPVAIEQMPDHLRKAFLAVEDIRFYDHRGYDLKAIARAAWVNYQAGGVEEGASTITQQLVRDSFLSQDQTVQRKVKELIIATELEKRFPKNDILEHYLNRIYLGHGAYGVQAAARVYFGKDVRQLTLGESAMLAGLPRNPSYYSPYRDVHRATERRNLVLAQMVQYGMITPEQSRQARQEDLSLAGLPKAGVYQHPYFVDYVLDQAIKRYKLTNAELYRGGLKIYTTLDPKAQKAAEKVFARKDVFPPSPPDQLVQSAVAVVDYRTGQVRALVGGRNYQTRRGFNRATQMARQPGSTMKPLASYGPALEAGFKPSYVMVDEAVSYGRYQPQNSDGRYRGAITMETALKYSVNVYAVKLLKLVGIERGFEFARNLGVPLTDQDQGLALALGGLQKGVSPLELAAAYGAFANGGIYREPIVITKITDYNGIEIKGPQQAARQVMSQQTAQTMTAMLQEVVKSGTGIEAQLEQWPVAGKTGTVQLPDLPQFKRHKGNKDAWFVGYTPELVAAVWLGYDHTDAGHYLEGVYGGTYPARIWREVIKGIFVEKLAHEKNS
ncbi:MAG: PBP1A family penicillin-binding protein [Clostridia bacterium]|nr:PBP1A family penicillin-binding protein [Clostridia bacterium]